ncbi:MAG: hypothetical protein PHT32_06270, partial [Candidatus Omnitrophica bacterium]|nr:hypothetical protein [Candidatus Omnitrophota bacterium]
MRPQTRTGLPQTFLSFSRLIHLHRPPPVLIALILFCSLFPVPCSLTHAYAPTDVVAGGIGAGWGYSDSAAVALDSSTIATDTVKLIRAGRTISSIARASDVVSVVLTSAYPNSNLVAGQRIVIAGVTGFNGTFTIATVADQTHFTYAEDGDNGSGSVDGSSIAGGDYTTLTSWEAAEGGDLVTATKIATAECYNDWASGLVEDVTISGNTTSASYYLRVTVPSSERHTGSTGIGFKLAGTLTVSDSTIVKIEYIEATGLASFSGAITDTGSLYTGGVSLASGASLSVAAFNNTFSGWGAITLNATSTLTYLGSSGSAATVTLIDAVHGNIALNRAYTTFNLPADFDINGNLTISSGTLDVTSSNYNITFSGATWTNNGTFTPRSGTVTLDAAEGTGQTIAGSSTFYNLTKSITTTATTLTFTAGTTQTINSGGTLTLTGDSDTTLTVASSTTSAAYLTLAGTATADVDYVSVSYSDASGGNTIIATTCTDGLNNVNWVFSDANTKKWVGTTTAWATDSNWSPSGAPTSSSGVVIDGSASAQPTISAADVTIDSLILSGASTLTLAGGAGIDLTVTNNCEVRNGATITYTQNTAGELTVNGTLTVYSGGTITCPYTDLTTTTTDSGGNTVAGGSGRTITAANIDIQSGGTITADDRGFPAGQGPGTSNN